MCATEHERALVLRAVEGDRVALKLLLTRTRSRLRSYLAQRISADLGRICDPEDLVQEAHIEVFRRLGTFMPRGEDSFFRFTAAIAMSLLRNAIKRNRTAKRGGGWHAVARLKNIEDSTIALLDVLAGHGKTPSQSVARHEAIEAVQGALADLPDRYQRAVWLVHIEGRTVREVASEMNRTERAIHGLCRRGLRLLQAELQSASRFLSSSG